MAASQLVAPNTSCSAAWQQRRGSSGRLPPPAQGRRPPLRGRRAPPPRALGLASAELLLAAVSALGDTFEPPQFEPQMRPEILVAAAVAAAPPIIFWARIFLSAQRRQAAIDAERTAEEQRRLQREELRRKITGQASPPAEPPQ